MGLVFVHFFLKRRFAIGYETYCGSSQLLAVLSPQVHERAGKSPKELRRKCSPRLICALKVASSIREP